MEISIVCYPFNDLLKTNRVRYRVRGSFRVKVRMRHESRDLQSALVPQYFSGLDITAFGLPALGQVHLKTYLPSY